MDKRAAILKAAKLIFEEKGYHASKISDIADEAGVGKGTVYGYFKSKQSLFEEMIIFFLDAYFRITEDLINKEVSAISKLRALIELDWEMTRDYSKFLNVLISRLSVLDDTIKSKFMIEREKNLNMIRDIIKGGIKSGEFRTVDTRLTALMFKGAFAQLNMDKTLSLNRPIEPADHAFDQKTEAMFQIFIHAIQA